MITDSELNIGHTRPMKRQRPLDIDTSYSSNDFPTLTASTNSTKNTKPISTNSFTVDYHFTRFFVVNSPDKTDSLNSISPFLIQKTFEGMVGKSLKLSKLRSGDLLVECSSPTQSKLISNLKLIGTDININCKPHPTLNYSKGVIRTRDFAGLSNDEILKGIETTENVKEITRLILNKNGLETKTNTFFITFDKPTLPDYLKIGYLKVPVQLYIPNPIRCYKCQKFGHGSKYCRSSQTCGKCGKPDHKIENCSNVLNCYNCKGNHLASSKECPNWIKEKEIIRIKTTKMISYPEAKQIYESEKIKNNQKSNTTPNIPQIKTQNNSQYAQVINPDRTQNIPQTVTQGAFQLAQEINPDGTSNINSGNINSDIILNRDLDRASYLNLDRVSGSNSNRTSNINSDRTLNMNSDRTPYLDHRDRTPYSNQERTPNINLDRTQTMNDMGTQTDINIEWLRETLFLLNERDPSFLPALLGGSGGYESVKLKNKVPFQIPFSEEEKENKKTKKQKSSLSCNSGQNGDGSDGCVSEPRIVTELIIGNGTNVVKEVIEKTNDDENAVILNSSDVSYTSVISKTNVRNPDIDYLSHMDTSQNDSSIHEGKIDLTFINSGESERFPSGEDPRKNQSTF